MVGVLDLVMDRVVFGVLGLVLAPLVGEGLVGFLEALSIELVLKNREGALHRRVRLVVSKSGCDRMRMHPLEKAGIWEGVSRVYQWFNGLILTLALKECQLPDFWDDLEIVSRSGVLFFRDPLSGFGKKIGDLIAVQPASSELHRYKGRVNLAFVTWSVVRSL